MSNRTLNLDDTLYRCLPDCSLRESALLRQGGPLPFDNLLWYAAVADPDNQEDDTQALRELDDRLHRDERVSIGLVPIGDGLTLAGKR